MPTIAEIEFTPAQKVAHATLRLGQIEELRRKWLASGTEHLTHREMGMLFKTARALSVAQGELWNQLDELNDALAEAKAGDASGSSSPWPGIVVLSVFLLCVTAIVVAFIAAW